MDLAVVLRDSWQISWRHKSLVSLALLAVGGGGLLQLVVRLQLQPWLLGFSAEGMVNLLNDPAGTPFPTLTIGLFFFLFIVAWLGGAMAEGGLIAGVGKLLESRPVTVWQCFGAGGRLLARFILADTVIFLPLFLYLLALLLLFGGGLLLFVVIVANNQVDVNGALAVLGVGGLVCGLPMVVLLVPAGALTWLFRLLAFRAIALEGQPVGQSIRQAWRLILSRPGSLILAGAFWWIIGRLAGWLIALLTLPFNTLALGGETLGNMGLVIGALVGLIPQAFVYLLVTAGWTVAYQQLKR